MLINNYKSKYLWADSKWVTFSSILLVSAALLLLNTTAATGIVAIAIISFCLLVFQSLRPLGFLKEQRSHLWTRGTLLAIALIPTSVLWAILISTVTGLSFDHTFFDQLRGNLTAFLISIPLVWLIGGFFEELIFRGFLQNQLERLLGGDKVATTISIALTAILFGYLHSYQGLAGQLLTGSIGAALGIIYVMNKRNLWINIIVHGVFDTIAMAMFYFEVDQLFIA